MGGGLLYGVSRCHLHGDHILNERWSLLMGVVSDWRGVLVQKFLQWFKGVTIRWIAGR